MANPINYDPNTPTPKLAYADWQIQFIQNFTQLNNAFSNNHVPLTSASNAGNHTYVQMPEQEEDQIPQTGAVEFSIYTRNVEDQTDQVFFTYPGNTPVVQFTNYQIYSVTPRVLPNFRQTTYFTFLPGKLLVIFGTMGPFSSGNSGGRNTLFLYPPVVKNIAAINLCNRGTTAQYTPEITMGTYENIPGQGLSFVPPKGIIKEIYINPNTNATNTIVDYLVVANI